MRRLLSVLLGLLMLMSLVPPLAGHAQTPDQPLVVFIEDKRTATSSIQDNGPDGISELAKIFESQGARVGWSLMDQPIPDDAQTLVLVRPLLPLSVDFVARLWVQMMRGKNLLLTLDPNGPTVFRGEGNARSNTDRAKAGLPTLLSLVYGISVQDTLVTEPWFSRTVVGDNRTAHLVAHVENIVQHPVLDPLGALDLPVEVWAARSMRVEPIGPHSYAVPLLYTQSAYGEASLTDVFRDATPLELNLGPDPVGTLLLGALGENTLTGSRVVVLGDSEMVENGFGLVMWQDTSQPIHVANRVLTERLAAWLLDRPVEEWPTLPATYTQMAVDGSNADWAGQNVVLMQDDTGDALVPLYDIQNVRAFRDDRYMYVLVELPEPPKPEIRLTLGFENTSNGSVDVMVVSTANETVLITGKGEPIAAVPDAKMAVGASIEVRLPLRVMGDAALLTSACVADSRSALASPPIDCAVQMPVAIPVATTIAPADTWDDGPHVIVDTIQAGVNVRKGPDAQSAKITTAYNGQVFSPIGRTALSDWVQVQNASYTAWMAAFLLKPNIDIDDLPVVTP